MVKSPLVTLKSSWSVPWAQRASAPTSQATAPACPCTAALRPRPWAGVENSLFAGVVVARPTGTATELFARSLVRSQACNRQPNVSAVEGCTRVAVAEVPLAVEPAPSRPAPRFSWKTPTRTAAWTVPNSCCTRIARVWSCRLSGVSAAPAILPRTGV